MKQKIRNFVFKNSHLIGSKLSAKFIRLGYLIECSKWYKKYNAPVFAERKEMYNFLIEKESLISNEICYMEFGVSKGWGFHFWYQTNKHKSSQFFGFDTFEGIPEDWGSVKKGAYTAEGKIPTVADPRCKFIVGLFQDTIDEFIKNNELNKRNVILFDAGLYNATLFVLLKLQNNLKAGDIIIFDEFFSVSKADHEMRAFIDFLSLYKINFEVIAKTLTQITIKIKDE